MYEVVLKCFYINGRKFLLLASIFVFNSTAMSKKEIPFVLIGFLLISLLFTSSTHYTEVAGVVSYEMFLNKSKQASPKSAMRQIQESVSDPLMQKVAFEAYKKAVKPSQYRLAFKGDESVYYKDMSDAPEDISNSYKPNYIFKNTAQKQLVEQAYIFTKPFLIKESLPKIEWEMMDSIRQIPPFEAHGAKAVFEGKELEVWYTKDLPVSTGPRYYWGLEGLILEVYLQDSYSIIFKEYATIFNEEDQALLIVPSKGKQISRKDYQKEKEAKTDALNASPKR